MSITAYKVEAVGHDRTGEDYGYVNIMYRYGNKQSCPRPDQCEKMEVMWADESVYGPPAPGSKVGDFTIPLVCLHTLYRSYRDPMDFRSIRTVAD